MIDSKAIAQELQHARQARLEAEAEYCDIEEMLWHMNIRIRWPSASPTRLTASAASSPTGRTSAPWVIVGGRGPKLGH
jgi:hypothetical protein